MRSALSLLARVRPRPGRQWLSCRDDNMRSERLGKPKLTPRYAANCIVSRQPRAAPWAWFFAPSSCAAQRSSLRLEPGNDLARDDLDLLHLVFVGNEDDLLRSDRQVRLELLDTLLGRSHDGAILGRFAPSGKIPFLAEPFHHCALDGLAGLADVDRQLRGVEQLVRVLSAFLCEAADLAP